MSWLPTRDSILQSDQEVLYLNIANLSIQLAVLGQVETAFRLVSALNTYDFFHGRSTTLRPLQQLWDTLGSWPEGEQEQIRHSIMDGRKRDAQAKARDAEDDEGMGRKQAKLEIDEKPITREDVKKAVRENTHGYAVSWWWPDKPGLYPSKEQLAAIGDAAMSPHDRELSPQQTADLIKQILEEVDDFEAGGKTKDKYGPPKFGKPSTIPQLDVQTALVSALDLRIKLNQDGVDGDVKAPSVEDILKKIGAKLDAGLDPVSYLAQSPRAWTVLKDGALARTIGIDEEKLSQFAQDVEDWATERMQNGKTRYAEASIRETLEKMNLNTRTTEEAKIMWVEYDRDPPETLFKDPATQEQITETEKRLNVQLPDDYKEFLTISNGFGEAFGGIILEPPLHSCENIRWFKDDESYFTELPLDIPNIQSYGVEEFQDWINVGKAIEIGTQDIDNIWLIPPETISEAQAKVASILEGNESSDQVKNTVQRAVENFAGSMEEWDRLGWCCVSWAAGGAASMQSYPSFKDYLCSIAANSGKSKDEMLMSQTFIGNGLKKDEEK